MGACGGGVAPTVSTVGTLAVRLVVSAVLVAVHRYLGLDGYPETEAAFAECVSLPIYPSLRNADANKILRHLRSILG